MATNQSISPCLWFNNNAEAAVKHYTSIFKNSRVLSTSRYTDAGPQPAGSVMTIDFELDGLRFIALNCGPDFTFNEAISLTVHCATQQEVDDYWTKLKAGGKEIDCGWVKDKFGLSWQIIPDVLPRMLQDRDTAKASRVMAAMLKMKKIDIAELQRAWDGEEALVGAGARRHS